MPESLLQKALAVLPPGQRSPLMLGPGEALVPATSMLDDDWLSDQIALRGAR